MENPSESLAPPPPTTTTTTIAENSENSNDNEVELSEQLLLLDDDDNFVSERDRQAQLADERRQKRRRRRRFNDDDEDHVDHIPLQKTDTSHDQVEAVEHAVKQETQAAVSVAATAVAASEMAVAPVRSPNLVDNPHLNDNQDDDDNEFDMFSSSVSPIQDDSKLPPQSSSLAGLDESDLASEKATTEQRQSQQDWDDAEGYYKAVIGETIHIDPSFHAPVDDHGRNEENRSGESSSSSAIRLRVAGVIGKGVFSTVLKCIVTSNSSSVALPPVVALKCIRHNETMAKAAITTELALLQRVCHCPGIVPLLLPQSTASSSSSSTSAAMTTAAPFLEHKGHVILLFNFMEYNLRDVLVKFGKGVGLSLQAVRSYFGQLLAAATHLQKHGIVHADLKPDNILVSADFAVVQLADFGSAMDVSSEISSSSNSAIGSSGTMASTATVWTPTPYLVSRFYRAPEIILGLSPLTFGIDLWSLAVTVAELYLGDVLFRGRTNNDMLYVMQQHLGAVSNRVIRQHIVAQRKFAVPVQFQHGDASTGSSSGGGGSYVFCQQAVDSVTGAPILKMRSLVTTTVSSSSMTSDQFPLGTPLAQRLKKAKSAKDSRKMIAHFVDLLTKCLALDPTRRIVLKEALRHEFFQTSATAAANTSNTANGSLP